MVTCDFIGRTGNQLWQIAATVNYALKHNMRFGFPQASINEREWPLQFKNLPRAKSGFKRWVQPEDGGYHEIPYMPDICLRGFFQSYKYIDHFETITAVRNLIGFDEYTYKGVAIHVRRGDYLIHKDAFPPLPIDYYVNALKGWEDYPKFIFSDDIEWCKKNFTFTEMTFINPADPVKDLFKMASYSKLITANSSYSTWAGLLGYADVRCPHFTQYYGFKNSHLDTSTLYPNTWEQIKF
jgi:hypothetical protein